VTGDKPERVEQEQTTSRVSGWKRATPAKAAFLLLAVAGVVKLWLVSGQHLSIIGNAAHDDRLFINLANSLLHGHGHYLGAYNNLTLVKGPFYSIYIALVNNTHIPLLMAEQIFYIIACFVFLLCVWPLVNISRKADGSGYVPYVVISLLGLLLIFNPMTSDQSVTRVVREGIYPSLALLTISLFVALLSYRTAGLWKYLLISIGAGLSLSAFWLTREEGIWIIPILVGLVLYLAAFFIWQWYGTLDFVQPRSSNQAHHRGWTKRLIVLAVPFVVLWLSIYTISLINNREYGVRNTVEVKTPQFLAAYSALTRVESGTWMPVIPVSARDRQLIYKVSPAFSELRPYLERNPGLSWVKNSESVYPQYKGEIAGGWFMWALRDAVAAAGYYKSGREAMSFYARLASEVNAACDQGRLFCVKSTGNLYPPLDPRYDGPFISTFSNSLSFLVTFKDYEPTPMTISGDKSSLDLFSEITHEPATNRYGHKRVTLLRTIGYIYQIIFPLITCLALVSYASMLFFKRSYRDPLFIVTGLIGATVVARMFLLSLADVTSFPSINTLYFSSAYPLLIIFVVLSLVLLYKWYPARSEKPGGRDLDMDVDENRG
jgi:hypothetical protein